MAPRVVVVAGPTAAGKSDAALRLCEERGGEIVSCDSLQVHRGFDIGSAKPSTAERARVRHHLVDVAAADEDYSAARYLEAARAALDDIAGRGRLAVVVGGTGLYLRALLHGLAPAPPRDPVLRARLDALAARFGDVRLWRHLRRVDPPAAARIAPRDRLRVVRALEVFHLTGRPLSTHHGTGEQPLAGFVVRTYVLDPGQPALRPRVERRTAAMLEAGLVEEARRLLERHGEVRALAAIGYREAVAHLRGALPGEQLPRAIVASTMQYAKRQRTWFRHQVAGAFWYTDGAALRDAARAWLDEEAA
ncbi:MAG: tRNA (adenosine(37)-N6)-dimethylallyltransferase MiaA [Vicinamibacteria bacterium]|nr:tRNA (adenosine(37)-N6)-dimethylallyltransferase MiaA [Vicinamibacteria bacterium]